MEWQRPRALLVTEAASGAMRLVEETAALVARAEKPAVVVAIAGRYRTGKSFLMNKLAGKHSGFELGNTVQSKTKGIWVWVLPHPVDSKKSLILLDTEGLGDVEQASGNHDTWIFVLAMLLSSTLVYNTTSTLDRGGLEQLHFVANMSEHVQMRARPRSWDPANQADAADCRAFFPSFVVCVRDFMLRLELDGRRCSSDDYLEHCLRRKSGGLSKECREQNAQREMLRSIFQERKCFVFPLPTDPERMDSLDRMEPHDLKPGFRESMELFYEHVVRHARVKHLEGTIINGRLLVELARRYVDAQARGAIPCIEQAVSQVARAANERASGEALGLYEGLQCELRDAFPVPADDVAASHVHAWEAALTHFASAAVLDRDHEQEKALSARMMEAYEKLVKQNKAASVSTSRAMLELLHKPIKEEIAKGSFHTAGGFKSYDRMMKELKKEFQASMGRMGDMAAQVLSEFLASVEDEGRLIMQVDDSVSELEKERKELEKVRARQADQEAITRMQSEELQRTVNLLQEQMRLNGESFNARIKHMEEMTEMKLQELKRQHQEEMERSKAAYQSRRGGRGGICSVM
ncbi:guanylate-binding protein 2-like [Petromyzon marinus]|uniref:Guanylate-binding protein 2-like n=1 Tax=Petromyzon marinus TaxID=7757 RepID=A0AAJ7UC70_PETMA|nr:guanylate-binding protein 2-like [Petromyzon marinus]